MTHSIIPPSSAHVWGAPNGCTGWVLMNQMYPQPETEASLTGTAAHDLAAQMVDAASKAAAYPARESIVGSIHANGTGFTDELYEAAQVYADDVKEIMRSTATFTPHVEQSLKIPRVHKQSFGTPDCWLFDRNAGKLYIWDAKFGHRKVEAYENWQLINYAAGILEQVGVAGDQDQYYSVEFRIVQPLAYHRGGPVRTWVARASDLRGYFNQLQTAAEKALGPNAQFRSGPHCRDCPGRHACPAALEGGLLLYEAATTPQPQELTPAALGLQLRIVQRALKQLEYLQAGYEAQVEALERTGTAVPGFKTEQNYGRESWTKPLEEVISLGNLLGVDLSMPAAVTPKEARKLGIDAEVIRQYAGRKPGAVKIVPDTTNLAKQVFQK